MSGNHVKDRHRGGASPRGDKRQKSAPTREQEERLLDVRAHEVPKKLSESSSSSHSSSALRKGSMATLFKESFFFTSFVNANRDSSLYSEQVALSQ